MWTSAPKVTCVLVACVPTRRDPTPVPDVRLATECLKTGRGVKVNSSQQKHCYVYQRPTQHICAVCQLTIKIPLLCNWIPPTFILNIYSDAHACLCWCACVSHRYWWVPVLVYLCQRDLSKLGRLLHLWELPNRVQSIIWRGALWRLVCSTPLIYMNSSITPHVYLIQPERTSAGGVSGSCLPSWIWVFFLDCRDSPVLQWMSNSLCCSTPDIDECALPTTCPWQTCTNTEGSFTCIKCQPGFRVSEDGQQCDGEAFGCVCTGMCFCLFVYLSTGLCVCDFLLYSNMQDLAFISQQSCSWGWMCQLDQVVCKQHQVWRLWPQSPIIWAQNPKILLPDITS